jgi:hypothetical protein
MKQLTQLNVVEGITRWLMIDRKAKRDAKNLRHRRNERRREFIRILRRSPASSRLLFDLLERTICGGKWNWY